MFYYVYGVCESVCSITSMVSWSLYVLLGLWCLGVGMFYYFYGNIQTPRHHRRNRTYRLADTIEVIEHTDILLRLWCLGVGMFYYFYGVWESVCSITSMVSGRRYVLLRLWCMGVCMLYYVYGVWESVCSITSMVSGSLYPDTIDVILHTDSQTP
jgi:hypothetical protein